MENLNKTKNKIIEFESEIIPCLADSNLYLNKFFLVLFFMHEILKTIEEII